MLALLSIVFQNSISSVVMSQTLVNFLEMQFTFAQDPVSGGYCTWCAQSGQLQSCSSCKLLFCTKCLSRNLGEECLSKAKVIGWQCCCCIPNQLERLISVCDKALNGIESSDPESSNTEFSGPENNGPGRYPLLHIFLFITITASR